MKNGILYIADAEASGGGAGAAALGDGQPPEGGQGGDNGQGGKADEGAGGGAGEQGADAKAEPAALTAESLAAALKQAGVGSQQQAPAEKRAYTQEEFDKAFHVFRPNKDQVAKLLAGGDEAVTVFTECLHAAARQATVMSGYQVQDAVEKLTAQFSPVLQFMAEQKEASTRAKFVEQNADLKGFEVVGEEVVKAMRQEGVKFETEDAAFKAIRERIIRTVKALPGWEQWKPGGKQQQQNGSKSNMPTLSKGGGSGGAAAGQGSQARTAGQRAQSSSPGQAVFGDD